VLIAALFVTGVSVGLRFAGLPVERLALGSMGVAGTATGLLLIGQALMPLWERAWWKPPPGRQATVRLGRLSSLGFGIGFGALGITFLAGAFLGEHDGLSRSAARVLLGTFAAAFALVMAGMECDRRAAQAAQAAVRTRGWLMASRREEDDLSADEAQRRQDARAELTRSIQVHLTGRTTPARVETRIAGDATFLTNGSEVVEQWRGFWSALAECDEIWEFSTVSRRGPARGEEGFARLRRGIVVDWFITAVVG
jgi:hypothetical protein